MILLGSLMLTGCSKLERIIDILLEEETEVTETETAETEAPEQTDAPDETETPAEQPEMPETPEQPVVPDPPEQSGTEETILPETESFAGHWECLYTDADGNELMLYLSMTDDGRASYSYGYGNSEMAEISAAGGESRMHLWYSTSPAVCRSWNWDMSRSRMILNPFSIMNG